MISEDLGEFYKILIGTETVASNPDELRPVEENKIRDNSNINAGINIIRRV